MGDSQPSRSRIGRGATIDPANRFERVRLERDEEQRDPAEADDLPARVTTELLPDRTRQVIVENHSPDIPFRYSINPYRGCEHGCSYC